MQLVVPIELREKVVSLAHDTLLARVPPLPGSSILRSYIAVRRSIKPRWFGLLFAGYTSEARRRTVLLAGRRQQRQSLRSG